MYALQYRLSLINNKLLSTFIIKLDGDLDNSG